MEQLQVLGREIARSSVAAALGTKGGLSKGNEAAPVNGDAQPLELGTVFRQSGQQGAVKILNEALVGGSQIAALQERIRQLEAEKVQGEIAALRAEFRSYRDELKSVAAPVAVSPANGSSVELGLLGKVLSSIIDRALAPPPNPLETGKATIELIKGYGSLLEPNENALRLRELDTRLTMAQWRREDERTAEEQRLQAEMADRARQNATMERLVKLGSENIGRFVEPISKTIVDGIRMRSNMPPLPAEAAAPAQLAQTLNNPPVTDYRAFTPEQRAEIRKRIQEARTILDSQEGQLNVSEQAAQPPTPPPAYGQFVDK